MAVYLDILNLPQVLQDPTIASLVLRAVKNHTNMPAIIIQWNSAGFNNVRTSPNNRHGVVGQDQNAIINFLVAYGATNYNNTLFLFRDPQTLTTCEMALPQWYEKFYYIYRMPYIYYMLSSNLSFSVKGFDMWTEFHMYVLRR